jgi:hypothetical protein
MMTWIAVGAVFVLFAFALAILCGVRINKVKELVDAQSALIKSLEARPEALIQVPIPAVEEMAQYQSRIASLLDDKHTKFYLVNLRRSIADDFEANGSDKAEYYRGKLAAVGDIISDSRKARRVIEAGMEGVAGEV